MTFKRDDTFSFQQAKSGDISISFLGKTVTILRGKAAVRFSERMDDTSDEQAQQLMARTTGNFKRGNERTNKSSP